MKTMKGWDRTGGTFTSYCPIGSEINPPIYDYFLGALPPRSVEQHGFLMGEPVTHDQNGNGVYMAFFQSYKSGEAICHYGGNQTVEEFRRRSGWRPAI